MKTKLLTITGALVLSFNPFISAQVCFNSATSFASAGTHTSSVASGDFNGDLEKDLVVTNQNSNTVSVLLGTGTGTFGTSTNFSVGSQPSCVISADFNGDGKADLATSNENSNNVSVLLGIGNGTFGSATSFGAGAFANNLATADFNGDLKADLAVTNAGSNTVSVLLGTGTGSFGPATNFTVSSGPTQVFCADFNGDSKVDLVVSGPNNVFVLLGTGTGSFGTATSYLVGSTSYSFTVGDFNGDGKIDLATANGSSTVSILLGTGSGSFGTATNFPATSTGAMIISADFNFDNNLDLAMVNSASNNLAIMLGTGTGNFGTAIIFAVGTYPYFLNATDFNGDGKIDLATANVNSTDVSILLNCAACTPIITTGLVAQYNFSGNANDLSGNNNNGTVNGATLTTDRFGNPNSAYSFNGTSAFIQIPNSTSLAITNNSISVGFWMKVSAWPTTSLEYYLFSKHSGTGNAQMGYHSYIYGSSNNSDPNNALVMRYRNGNTSTWGGASKLTNTLPVPGTWFHVVYTVDNTSTKMYVNGGLVDTEVAQIIGANTSDLFIGKDPIGGQHYSGLLDDIRIYNRALTLCDVDSLYTMPNPCTNVTASITPNGTTTFCQGGNVILTATSAISYLWSNGGATTQSITVSNAGNYSVTTTNSNGCSATSPATVVTVNSLPTVTLSPLTSICENASAFNLTGGTPNGGTYSGTGVSGNAFNPSVSGVGTFPITYSYTDGNTCSSSASQNIIVNPAPTVTLSPMNPVCSNATAFSLTGGTPSGGTYSGTGVSGNSFTPSIAGLGTFPITYSFTDGNSCSGSASQNITVYSCIGTCFSTPDGVDGSNWSYKDFIIPTGYKLDSIFMDATRPSYPAQDFDLVVESCQGTTTYNNTIGTYPFSYTTDNNSEYNIWINLTSFNYISTGMVRVSLPTNAGAIWNNLCFATSLQNITWTPCSTAAVPYGGQTYNTVQIGTQCWFHENLNIGTQVANVNAETNNSIVEKACYNNTSSNCNTYGGIYNWDEAMNYGTNEQGICPTGWHIASQTDFQTLINYLGATTAGQKMKVTSSDTPPWDGSNTSFFNSFPSGIGQGTNYLYMGTRSTYWSSTQSSSTDAYDYDLSSGSNALTEFTNTKDGGYCIRCIQDITTGIFSPNGAVNYFALYPNPSTDNCEVAFSLNANANAKLTIYNLIGEQVSTVFESTQFTSGEYKFSIKTSELVSGIYFINLTVDGKSTIKKMVKLN